MTHNFSAGPSVLPREVTRQAAEAVLNFEQTGLSILEMSHRGKHLAPVLEEAMALVRELMQLPSEYEVMFLTGGASTQFFMVPLNLAIPDEKMYYINTGAWSSKAIKEAGRYGKMEELASSADKNFTYIPKLDNYPTAGSYLHITTNNTIHGTQFHQTPPSSIPIVADMSSDIFSKPIENINQYGCIYAGAQKNMGPAGTTLVIMHKDMLGKTGRDIPTMLDYKTHINKRSAFNTWPVYAIYVSLLVLRWIKAQGGVAAMAHRNKTKAEVLYAALDNSKLFHGTVSKEDRSEMNVCFRTEREDLESEFLQFAAEHHCSGLKGHRSVGGFRASLYNALELESVGVLIEVMQAFEKKHG